MIVESDAAHHALREPCDGLIIRLARQLETVDRRERGAVAATIGEEFAVAGAVYLVSRRIAAGRIDELSELSESIVWLLAIAGAEQTGSIARPGTD